MDVRKAIIIVIIAVCVFALGYGVYYQISRTNNRTSINTEFENNEAENNNTENYDFDTLFDNNMNYQNYSYGSEYKSDTSKDLVYTVYKFSEINEGKYDINVELPLINLRNSKANDINREIILTFGQKVQSIITNADKGNTQKTIYTTEYTSYLNENILSVVIRATLKEGSNAQRVIIKAYTYNLSSNEEISLKTMLEIKGLDSNVVKNEIINVVQENEAKNANLVALGYNIYQRDLNSDIYEIENSNNYFLGPDGIMYIIYAYGNTRYTSEKDIVVIR